jgi:hypothetical protein
MKASLVIGTRAIIWVSNCHQTDKPVLTFLGNSMDTILNYCHHLVKNRKLLFENLLYDF